MKEEIWRDVPGFSGYYQVSNLGKVKSLERKRWNTRNNSFDIRKERLLTVNKSGVYDRVCFCKNYKEYTFGIHVLVAMAFLKHIPCGHRLVVNHKDFNKKNNYVDNLEIITSRENTNQKHIKSTSKYVGVCWRKDIKKWISRITINGKLKHLGYFDIEYDAHLAYEKALNELTNNT